MNAGNECYHPLHAWRDVVCLRCGRTWVALVGEGYPSLREIIDSHLYGLPIRGQDAAVAFKRCEAA